MPSEEFSICDECGEYTKNIVLQEGKWFCGRCMPVEGIRISS
ncbi:MAG: hypothetical protein ISS93_01580 [Candidatus Aenigmarchaeota archaeon]|nr:hypothetical protein [Candidatus Aenigmarchaeota archaeon]